MDFLFESQNEGKKVYLRDLINEKSIILVLLRHLG